MPTIVESVGRPADVYTALCPSRYVLDHIAGKWTVLIIDALAQQGSMRYSGLHKRIQGVSQKMLTQTLRLLEADGLVKRTLHPSVPPRVDYELTELGQSLRGPLAAIRDWTEQHVNDIERARAEAGAAPIASAAAGSAASSAVAAASPAAPNAAAGLAGSVAEAAASSAARRARRG